VTIEIQIWMITITNIVLVLVVSYQSVILGRLNRTSFGHLEAVAWILWLIFRVYSLVSLKITIEQAKVGGLIRDSFSFDQWIGISGNLIFIIIMIISKHKERKAIKRNWGV
jgi:hypothetical protein